MPLEAEGDPENPVGLNDGGKIMQDRLLDVSVVAQRLYVSTSTVYRLLWGGYIPFVKMGIKRGYKVRETDLNEFIRKREESAGYE